MNDIFKVYDFENEQQWLKGRMNGIGGSDASAVVGMNPYKSNIDLFEEKIGRVMPKDISDKPCVIYGKNAEEYIRELFKLDYPEYTVDHHEFRILQSKDHPFMQASLDGELTDRERFELFLTEKRYDRDGCIASYSSDRKLSAADLLTGQYLEKELGKKVETLIASAKREVEESLINSFEQKLKENLAKDTIERMNIPEVLKRFSEMALEEK